MTQRGRLVNALSNICSKDRLWYVHYYFVRLFRNTCFVSDELYLKTIYFQTFGRELNLFAPRAYTEWLQWMKLYDHNPLYSTLVDKYRVKDYVSNIIGQEYVNPMLGVWNSFDEIDFDSLPEKFVLKVNHDSGGVVICKSKDLFDKKAAKLVLDKALKSRMYPISREWPYKNVKPVVFAEKFMTDKYGELRDYKFFCFNGVPRLMFIATGRQDLQNETSFDFFDMDGCHLDLVNIHQNAKEIPQLPSSFELMKALASKLSQGLRQVRVDFYEVDDKPIFGEYTFFHNSGFAPFYPDKWDFEIGEWMII